MQQLEQPHQPPVGDVRRAAVRTGLGPVLQGGRGHGFHRRGGQGQRLLFIVMIMAMVVVVVVVVVALVDEDGGSNGYS